LKNDGTVWAWGRNASGQLGDGTTTDHSTPVQVTGLTGINAIAAGRSHSLALKNDATLWAWGSNGSGQLGDGTTTERNIPVAVSGLSNVTSIAAGSSHSIALRNDGTVRAWGDNFYSQLGNGTAGARVIPTEVLGLSQCLGIGSGWGHSIAIRDDGTLWAWGDNSDGQLGNGMRTTNNTPVEVSGLTGLAAAAAGQTYSLAAKTDGTLWAWGENQFGQLGDGTGLNRGIPVQIANMTGGSLIVGGFGHSVALKTDGTVWTWGWNGFGQIGDDSLTSRNIPSQVSGVDGVTAISAGDFNIACIKGDGIVWGWGANSNGQLGTGSSDYYSGVPVAASGISGITKIAAGAEHILALKDDGTVWAWGWNGFGQLGDGTTENKATAVQVSTLTEVSAIAAGFGHSMALKNDGTVWTWGWNGSGQLGDDSTTDKTTPVHVEDLSNVIAIAAGRNHSVALLESGYVYAWGDDAYFQTGDSTPFYNDAPYPVPDLSNVVAIAAGGNHCLAIKNDGTLWTWGSNAYGQLGNGAKKWVPGQVVEGSGQGFFNLLGQEPQVHTLTIDPVGNGMISSTPSGIECGADCVQEYTEGILVSLNAIPDPGWSFGSWSGACTGTGNCQVTMDGDKGVTVTFANVPAITHTLTVNVTGDGWVASSPGGINCGIACTQDYSEGSTITLIPTPDPGWVFSGWSGTCSGSGPCQVIMDQEKTVSVTFESKIPVAAFTGAPLSGSAPLTVNFTDQSTKAITSWEWDFGDDNATSTEQNPSHTYHNPATYTVSLKVTGPYGSDTEVKDDYVIAYTAGVIYIVPDGTCGGHNPCYKTIQEGINAASHEVTIKITEGAYDEELTLSAAKALVLQGGWDTSFTTQSSNSKIRSLRISRGTVTVNRLVIK